MCVRHFCYIREEFTHDVRSEKQNKEVLEKVDKANKPNGQTATYKRTGLPLNRFQTMTENRKKRDDITLLCDSPHSLRNPPPPHQTTNSPTVGAVNVNNVHGTGEQSSTGAPSTADDESTYPPGRITENNFTDTMRTKNRQYQNRSQCLVSAPVIDPPM